MISVIKANGEKEPFNEEKVKTSIKRSGIPDAIQGQVVTHVQSKLYDNIPTSEIYRHIVEFLGNSAHPHTKVKYGLKQAIMAFGPTGYPFEDFVAEILKTQGYTTKVRSILQGKCITHEIDVIAEKNNTRIMIEAKFHNASGIKTDVHVALYTKARFDDIKEKNNLHESWIITNTKATNDAVTYALCVGMKIISWDYPEGESLRELIEKSGLTPITALTTLSQAQIQTLLKNDFVLCRDVCKNPKILDTLNLSADKKQEILSESAFACKI